MPGALVALRLWQARDLQRERDVVDDGAPGERGLLLEDHADRWVRPAHALARDLDRALVAVEQPADDVEQGRFAAAGGADDAHELAGRDRERDVVDRREHAVRRLETLDDIVDNQNRLHGRGRRKPGVNAFKRHSHASHQSSPLGHPSVLRGAAGRSASPSPYSTSPPAWARTAPAKLCRWPLRNGPPAVNRHPAVGCRGRRQLQPGSACNGRFARRHQFSQARLMPYEPVRDATLSTSPAVRNLTSPMSMACFCSRALTSR